MRTPYTSTQRLALRGLLVQVLVVACVVAVLLANGCAKQERPLATAKVLNRWEVGAIMPSATLGDSSYAQVDSAALPALYEEFRAEIFRKGVTKWDDRFDCNHFAAYFAALAQTKFYLANFHSRTPAQSLAVGTYWYQSAAGPHAIVVALTERGPVFIEPQTGGELTFPVRPQTFLNVF